MSIELSEIILKISGPVTPIGDSAEDKRRLQNFNDLSFAIEKVLRLVYESANFNLEHYESSRLEYGRQARKFLRSMKDFTDIE